MEELPLLKLLEHLFGKSAASDLLAGDLEHVRGHIGVIVEGLEVHEADEETEQHDVEMVGREHHDDGERQYESVDPQRVVDVYWSSPKAHCNREHGHDDGEQEEAIVQDLLGVKNIWRPPVKHGQVQVAQEVNVDVQFVEEPYQEVAAVGLHDENQLRSQKIEGNLP